MIDKKDIFNSIENIDNQIDIDYSDLKDLLNQYPFFQTARLLLAKKCYQSNNNQEFDTILPKTAVFCSDRKRLFYMIKSEKYNKFFKEIQNPSASDRTQELLDSYLTEFSSKTAEDKIDLNIVAGDYIAFLEDNQDKTICEQNEEQFELKHHDIIDGFLQKAEANEISFVAQKNEKSKADEYNEDVSGNGFLSETLSKIYIKQKKYEQALAIIKQLSLNFPKKSVYFADQIRFLEYLVINERNKK